VYGVGKIIVRAQAVFYKSPINQILHILRVGEGGTKYHYPVNQVGLVKALTDVRVEVVKHYQYVVRVWHVVVVAVLKLINMVDHDVYLCVTTI
jgi:hypothetical protein